MPSCCTNWLLGYTLCKQCLCTPVDQQCGSTKKFELLMNGKSHRNGQDLLMQRFVCPSLASQHCGWHRWFLALEWPEILERLLDRPQSDELCFAVCVACQESLVGHRWCSLLHLQASLLETTGVALGAVPNVRHRIGKFSSSLADFLPILVEVRVAEMRTVLCWAPFWCQSPFLEQEEQRTELLLQCSEQYS